MRDRPGDRAAVAPWDVRGNSTEVLQRPEQGSSPSEMECLWKDQAVREDDGVCAKNVTSHLIVRSLLGPCVSQWWMHHVWEWWWIRFWRTQLLQERLQGLDDLSTFCLAGLSWKMAPSAWLKELLIMVQQMPDSKALRKPSKQHFHWMVTELVYRLWYKKTQLLLSWKTLIKNRTWSVFILPVLLLNFQM